MSDDNNKQAAEDILKMLREAGVSTESLVEKSHAFWDTQVRNALDEPFAWCFVASRSRILTSTFSVRNGVLHPNCIV